MRIEKQHKIELYLKGYFNAIFNNYKEFKKKKEKLISKLTDKEIEICYKRKDYYNKGQYSFKNISSDTTIESLIKNLKKPKAYYFDFFEYARFFDKKFPVNCIFGDVDFVPEHPSIVKSRPILTSDKEQKGILLNLDKQRHFRFIKNDIEYSKKKNILFGRLSVFQQHRQLFFEKHFSNPLLDIGQVNQHGGNETWLKQKETVKKHLQNKLILSLEGNDVATNLKWIMSSNSIAVSPPLKFETWYMEGTLEGDKHYLEIAEDYSDLNEKLESVLSNPQKAEEIIKNAHEFSNQFQNKDIEDFTSLLVLESLFY